jgi:hypothetical protein
VKSISVMAKHEDLSKINPAYVIAINQSTQGIPHDSILISPGDTKYASYIMPCYCYEQLYFAGFKIFG